MKQMNNRHEEAPWTAARCSRLLRTITSRLSILRKLAKHGPRIETVEDPAASDLVGLAWPSRPISADASSPPSYDPDWVPQGRKRRAEKTYGRKWKRLKARDDAKQADVVHGLRTPFVRRVLASSLAASPSESPLAVYLAKFPQADPGGRRRRCLPILPTDSAEQAYRGLLDAFDALLLATKPESLPCRRGASSLLKTCLRKVPNYIHLEQSYAAFESDLENGNIISDTYEYLESFGSCIGRGWKDLRDVVRAHATSLIQGALKDNILPSEAVESFLGICSIREATTESQLILASWLKHCDIPSKARIEKFVTLCTRFGHRSILIQCCGDLLRRNPIAHHYLSENIILWRELVKAFISPSMQVDASSFCETYITGWREQESISTEAAKTPDTFAMHDSLVLLTAYAWKKSHVGLDHDIARHILRWPVYATLTTSLLNPIRYIQSLLMASLVLQITDCKAQQNIHFLKEEDTLRMIRGEDTSGEVIATMSEFITEVAKKILQVDRIGAHAFIKSATSGLLQLSMTTYGNIASVSNRIVTTTAKAWADHCDDVESYHLLEEIGYAAWDSPRHCGTPNASTSPRPTTYRWEEGLCEWIAKTPNAQETPATASPLSKECLESVHDSGVDLGYDSPKMDSMRIPMVSDDDDALDDEDELALSTPIRQRQKRGRVRFEVPEHYRRCAMRTHKFIEHDQVPVLLDDASEDELSF